MSAAYDGGISYIVSATDGVLLGYVSQHKTAAYRERGLGEWTLARSEAARMPLGHALTLARNVRRKDAKSTVRIVAVVGDSA